MAQSVSQIRAWIRRDRAAIAKLIQDQEQALRAAYGRRDERIRRARDLGASGEELAADAGMSVQRISQIAPKRRKKEEEEGQEPDQPAESAAEAVPVPGRVPLEGDELPARFRPGASARVAELLSDYVTDAWSKNQPERPTIFVDTRTGEWCSAAGRAGRLVWERRSASELLAQLPDAVQRVFLVGPRPSSGRVRPGEEAEAGRLWFLEDVPGWRPDGHWFPDDGAPIGRWQRGMPDGQVRKLEVLSAGEWFGQSPYSVAEAARAWAELRSRIMVAFGGNAILLSTPATTGRDLWRRTIGKTKDGKPKTYPVLSDELRELIQSTSGQGRREVIPEGPQTVPGFAQYDMRFAYAALAWGLPVGAPEMVTGIQWAAAADSARERLLKGRGRWLVTATVPHGWEHVGILGAPAARSLWCYPRQPGQTFTTWTSGTELALAHANGWHLVVHEGMHWKEGRPLNLWRDKLTALYAEMDTSEWARETPSVARLVKIALRNMVLTSIGAFASRAHKITRHAPMTPEGEKLLPDNAPVRIVGTHYEWQQESIRSEWVKRLDHPEWSAEIWGRCRGRLLEAPTGRPNEKVGALHVPPGMVLGMRTDALYLAGDPRWHDDGAVGRYRLESSITGELARPQDDAELGALKALAAGGSQ